jgi:hypothetical protein
MDADMLSNEIADQIADSLASAFEVGSDEIMDLIMNDDEALLDTIKDSLGVVGVERDREAITGDELHRLLLHIDSEDLFPFKIGDSEVVSFSTDASYQIPELVGIIRHAIQLKQGATQTQTA